MGTTTAEKRNTWGLNTEQNLYKCANNFTILMLFIADKIKACTHSLAISSGKTGSATSQVLMHIYESSDQWIMAD